MQSNHGGVGRNLRGPQRPVLSYRQSTLADAVHVGSNLRLQDYIEAYLQSHGKEPAEALKESYRSSQVCLSACLEERPIAVFGIGSADESKASPWLLATPEADRFPKEMISFGRQFVSAWLNEWDCLYNVVYAENARTIRWLKHLGFTVGGPQPIGHLGAPFCLFYQYRIPTSVC